MFCIDEPKISALSAETLGTLAGTRRPFLAQHVIAPEGVFNTGGKIAWIQLHPDPCLRWKQRAAWSFFLGAPQAKIFLNILTRDISMHLYYWTVSMRPVDYP